MRTIAIAATAVGMTLALSLTCSTTTFAGDVPVTAQRIIDDGLIRPTFATHAPGDFTRLFVVEKAGEIRIYNLKTRNLLETPFLDIDAQVGSSGNEQGLLGLAFHPDYLNNGYFYVNFTNNSGNTEVRRFEVSEDPNIANTTSELVLSIAQPFSNHNGGWIGFGPDGYLYIATGDGGSACDPGGRAQDITNQWLGKMLRVDVDGDDFPKDDNRNYAIPPDNPFVGEVGDDEIWAYGLRNPWRNSFDAQTGDFYIADVGQGVREEINVQAFDSDGGINYGWDCEEGTVCASLSGCGAGSCSCGDASLTPPVHDYSHAGGNCSITGGYVYRGCRIPSEHGNYFFTDYCSANIWSFQWDGADGIENFENRTNELDPPNTTISGVSSFGEDAWGDMYIVEDFGADVFRLIPTEDTFTYADMNCDGAVNSEDLLQLLAGWGSCVGCAADIDGDDEVTSADLLKLLEEWG